ncbi:MAG: hypothetical protein DRJ47_06470 [Thermoprotei archaeon]|nr:MAG: hypothetical protein DRJ47_06470 [Thermoprotei archaeon]
MTRRKKLPSVKTLTKQIKEATKVFNNLQRLSRVEVASRQPLKVIDTEKMNYIVERMSEANEKVYNFSRSTSQVSRKLQTLSMLFPADATYRVLHQILAQIERKQQAITENTFRIKKELLEVEELKRKLEQAEDDLKRAKLELEIQRKQVSVSNTFSYLEAALKEVGFLLEAYEEVKKNKGIPDNWDEYDFEKAEIEAHIKGAFRNAIRDFLVHGRIGMGTCEWFEQLGISPFEAVYEVSSFVRQANQRMNQNDPPDYDEFYDFLNRMAKKYGKCYKKACKNIGISDKLVSERFTLILPKPPETEEEQKH